MAAVCGFMTDYNLRLMLIFSNIVKCKRFFAMKTASLEKTCF